MSADYLKALPWLALYALAFLVEPQAGRPSETKAARQSALQVEASHSQGS